MTPEQQAPETRAGRTQISSRALDRVVGAVAADALGVATKAVHVRLGDDKGSLAIAVASPIRAVPLDSPARVARPAESGTQPAVTLVQRADAAQHTIKHRVGVLTGSAVGLVEVRLTGVRLENDRRVE
ncbi:hypothetical protein [Subtercola frigoramans]|uniref:Alkaline shock family protein YloU n=1 Tax=Subtercola frigoramans TaxID=120298 RepID=A0ABS2L0J2_9MICO|nr:hypothetical protein [Subtercola frigoramans]MBM7470451.1 putative alkaline shock family protein YloU [Subtercola frigoramans]